MVSTVQPQFSWFSRNDGGRGLSISHTMIMRWVHQCDPALDKRVRHHLKKTNDSWRVEETYTKVKGK